MAGLNLMLASVLALELREGASKADTAAILPPPAAPGATILATAAPRAWVATILARPLFDPSRAPAASARVPGSAAPAPPRLAGIIVTPGEKDAVFAPASGPVVIATEGGRVGPYTIREISREVIVLDGPQGAVVLHAGFATGTVQSAEAPAPVSPASLIDGITGTPGGIWLDHGKAVLPSAATWPGVPPLAGLAVGPAPGAAPAGLSLTRPGA